MNKLAKILGVGAVALTMVSCGSSKEIAGNHYQIYKVEPVGNVNKLPDALIYEDDVCQIRYDFWQAGGNVGFVVYNKSDKDIYLNMSESFYIHNGIAFDYYQNRVFTTGTSNSVSKSSTSSSTNTTSTTKSASLSGSVSGAVSGLMSSDRSTAGAGGASVGVGVSREKTTSNTTTNTETSTNINSTSVGVNTVEKDVICVPSKTAKVISEFNVSEEVYEDKKLTRTQLKSNTYTENESPFVFSNRLTYTVKGAQKATQLEHKFFVSEISNHHKKEVTEIRVDKNSGEKEPVKREYFKDPSPDRFFIKY